MNYDDMNNLRCGNPICLLPPGQEENQSLRCQGNSTGDYSREDVVLGKSLLSGANRPTRLSKIDGATGLSR